MRNWYAVHCKPRQDHRAELNLQNLGYEVFRPLALLRKYKSQKAVESVESLFPRYLFICLEDEGASWAPIRSTRGVAAMVMCAGIPGRIPDAFIDNLRARMGEYRWINLSASAFQANDRVRIESGAFVGHEALFISQRGTDRVMVLMAVMNRLQQIELPAHAIQGI